MCACIEDKDISRSTWRWMANLQLLLFKPSLLFQSFTNLRIKSQVSRTLQHSPNNPSGDEMHMQLPTDRDALNLIHLIDLNHSPFPL